MLHFRLSREDWDASVEFNEDAAEAPHVDASRVGDANYDLRCPIEATLNVGVDPLVGEARRTEVDDLDA